MMVNTTAPPVLPPLKHLTGARLLREHTPFMPLRAEHPPLRGPLTAAAPSSDGRLETQPQLALSSSSTSFESRSTSTESGGPQPTAASEGRLHSVNGSSDEERDGTEPGDAPVAIGDKRARRKEQCRVNQAAYRKRKRQHEQELARYIKTLHIEIGELVQQKDALSSHQISMSQQTRQTDANEEIESFYQSMNAVDTNAQNEPPHAQIAALLALQFEEFESMDDLQRRWHEHCRRFHRFTLRVQSARSFEVGELVLIKVSAEVEIAFVPDASSASDRSGQWWQAPLVCAVQHQFEVDTTSHSISRVVSEVDVVAAVVVAAKRVTRHVPRVLEEFVDLCGVQRYPLPVLTP